MRSILLTVFLFHFYCFVNAQQALASMSNITVDGGCIYFDVNLRAQGLNIYLGDTDISFKFNIDNFGSHNIEEVDGSTLVNSLGNPIFASISPAIVLQGRRYVINIASPNPTSVGALNNITARMIDGTTYRLGRYRICTITNPAGLAGFECDLVNTFVFSINPANYNQFQVTDQCTAPPLLVPLPVELLRFSVQAQDNESIVLNWSSAMEQTFSHYEIERSVDGSVFQKIGLEAGKGGPLQPATYQYTDERPFTGMNYYRLKMVDQDGAYKYSDIEAARIGSKNGMGLNVWPTPTPSGFNAVLNLDHAAHTTWQLSNALGVSVAHFSIQLDKGDYSHYYDLSDYPNGLYHLNVRTETGLVSEKIIKVD